MLRRCNVPEVKLPEPCLPVTFLFTVAVFLFIVVWFAWLNSYPGFRDPDGFYHAKMVELLRDHGLVRDFLWLPLTVLADHFADHHLFYHLLALPLAYFVSPLLAVKITSVIIGVFACLALYFSLRIIRVPKPELFVLLTAITPYFALRATMVKASGLAMIFQFTLLAALLTRRTWMVFIISFLYVFAHGSFPFALMIVALLIAAKTFVRAAEGDNFSCAVSSAWGEERRSVAAIFAGLISGLVINPYFPENLFFYWHQIIQIAIVGTPKNLMVGSEWYGASPQTLLLMTSPMILLILVLTVFIILSKTTRRWEREAAERFTFIFLLTAVTFVMTLRANRHIEYFLPYLTLMVGCFYGIFFHSIDFKYVFSRAKELLRTRFLRLSAVLGALLAFTVPLLGLVNTGKLLRGGTLEWDRVKQAAEVIRKNAEPDEIVFDGAWDYFPELWYWNDKNRYISGLDPRFLAAKNPDLALRYQNLDVEKASAKEIFSEFPVHIIAMPKTSFRSRVIDSLRKESTSFEILFEDEQSIVFNKID